MIFDKVAEILKEDMMVEGNITMESDFFEDFNFDSLDFVELVMALEDEFNIEVSEDEQEELEDKVKTVGDIVELLKERV